MIHLQKELRIIYCSTYPRSIEKILVDYFFTLSHVGIVTLSAYLGFFIVKHTKTTLYFPDGDSFDFDDQLCIEEKIRKQRKDNLTQPSLQKRHVEVLVTCYELRQISGECQGRFHLYRNTGMEKSAGSFLVYESLKVGKILEEILKKYEIVHLKNAFGRKGIDMRMIEVLFQHKFDQNTIF
ncbi:hypothetical protein GINT2_001724 [Glugoides intestinalis]